MSEDIFVDEVRRVRAELIKRYGGLDGWMDHLQEMDRERAARLKRAKQKRAKAATKGRKQSTKTPTSRIVK